MSHSRGKRVVFVKRDSPGHAGPALSLPGTFVEKIYVYPKHLFTPPNTGFHHQTPLFAPNTPFQPSNTCFTLWPTPHLHPKHPIMSSTPLYAPKHPFHPQIPQSTSFAPQTPQYTPTPLFSPNTPVRPKAVVDD